MLIVIAYVDIFGFIRADNLEAALDGKVATMGIAIDQAFLVFTTAYVLIPTLMVVLSLVLRSRVNRIANNWGPCGRTWCDGMCNASGSPPRWIDVGKVATPGR